MLKKAQTRKEYNCESLDKSYEEWPQNRWENEGRPHIWCTVEKHGGYEVQKDRTYGGMRLLLNDKIVDCGETVILYKNKDNSVEVMVADKQYYGMSKYLWF